MARVQLALNVDDITEAIEFYSKLFGVRPHKVRDDYANFVVVDPPLKLVLIANGGEPGTMNHVGIEVSSTDEVVGAAERAAAAGLSTTLQEATSCCYALQDKVWVHGPNTAWEIYTVLDENGEAGGMHTKVVEPGRRLQFLPADGGSCGIDGTCC
jgi:catechol 2,3-dioxygenase-like lactoylglutathione lyase family enzyme